MPDLSTPRPRVAFILALYAQQGLVAGFAVTALPNHLAAHGASAAEIGSYLAMVGLPWVAQPLWGPVADRVPRRRALLAAQLAALLALLALALLAPQSLPALGALLLLHGLAASLMDTATDGLIMDVVPTDALGTATACTRIGFAGGIAGGAALFALLIPRLGISGAAGILLGGCAVLALAPLLLAHGPARPGAHSLRALMLALGASLREARTLVLLGFCMAQDFAGALYRVPLGVALLQGEGAWTPQALSALQGSMALGAGTLGALLVGWWTDRAGPGRALQALLGAAALSHLAAALLGPGAAAMALSGVTSALSFVALAPAVMIASRGPAAASRFTLYMAALNLGDVSGVALAAPLAGLVGLSGSALAACLLLAGLAALTPRMLRLGNV
jgi:PAT family beta-lactamase induction signal transducer AmpG